MLSKNLKFSVLAAGLLFSINAMADTGLRYLFTTTLNWLMVKVILTATAVLAVQ